MSASHTTEPEQHASAFVALCIQTAGEARSKAAAGTQDQKVHSQQMAAIVHTTCAAPGCLYEGRQHVDLAWLPIHTLTGHYPAACTHKTPLHLAFGYAADNLHTTDTNSRPAKQSDTANCCSRRWSKRAGWQVCKELNMGIGTKQKQASKTYRAKQHAIATTNGGSTWQKVLTVHIHHFVARGDMHNLQAPFWSHKG